MTLDSAPQWSDWHTRNLGFADTPNAICCRICHLTKPAHGLHFRKDSVPVIGFSNVCRKCETATPELRTAEARLKRLVRDPSLSPLDKELQILDVPETVRKSKSALASRNRTQPFDLAFRVQWTTVRKIVAWRNHLLSLRIGVSKAHQSRRDSASANARGLAKAIEDYQQIANYIRYLKTCYSNVVSRLRDLEGWHATIGSHLPPSYWRHDLDVLHAAFESNVGKEGKPRLTDRNGEVGQALWSFAVAELLTKEERDTLSRMAAALTDCAAWQDIVPVTDRGFGVVSDGRANGTLQYLVYPWLRQPDPVTGQERPAFNTMTPPWLRAFNGS